MEIFTSDVPTFMRGFSNVVFTKRIIEIAATKDNFIVKIFSIFNHEVRMSNQHEIFKGLMSQKSFSLLNA